MSNELKIGIIGYDTSHAPAFAKLLNDNSDPDYIAGARIVAGYPSFSPDLESSASRVEAFTKDLAGKYGVETVNSIDELLSKVDAVLLESVDGRRHLAEAAPVIAAGKPVFIDKPLAQNYTDAAAIVQLAAERGCPLMSSSSLRYDANIAAIRNDPELGDVVGCDAFGPANLDPSNPGLFWYGIHAVETLYTFMGRGCVKVHYMGSTAVDQITGVWADGRVGTVRGLRRGAHDYGATVFGSKKVSQATYSRDTPLYAQLMREVVPFLQGGASPIDIEETIEMMAFMQAAIVSGEENREVGIAEITGA